jgi:hypothetical protein
MNKYLLKIVIEYIDYKLIFTEELKTNTNMLYEDFSNWRYYDNYSIKYDDTTGSGYNIGYIYGNDCKIRRNSDSGWYCHF